MLQPQLTILYVDQPSRSAAFYSELLKREPVESSPTFAAFAFESGAMLGLWSRHTVEPAAINAGWNGELAFRVAYREEVDTLFDGWSTRGLKIVQQPTELDFGYTFVALDPDGHRLRIYFPFE